MELDTTIQQHVQERDMIKSRIYDMEKRIAELNVIVASLEEAKKLTTEEANDEGEG